jgi:glucose-6-phosphate-specific signal transduction histidine kinase
LSVETYFFFYLGAFLQSISLLRAEIEIKLGRSQCNIILSRLKPWLLIHSSKKKKVVLREEASVAKPKSNDNKTITWTCKFSTPEMTIMLYNMAGFPVYRVSICVCVYSYMYKTCQCFMNKNLHHKPRRAHCKIILILVILNIVQFVIDINLKVQLKLRCLTTLLVPKLFMIFYICL